MEDTRFKSNKELNRKNPFSKFVVDEGWEEIKITPGVKQINEELKEDEPTDNTTNISESKSN